MSTDRDWRRYNKTLVRMGKLNLDPSVVEEWKRELKKANEGKVGGALPLPRVVHQVPRIRPPPLPPALQADRGFVKSLSSSWRGSRPLITPR